MKTIIFDVDGVLADFVKAFVKTAQLYWPKIRSTDTRSQKTWSFQPLMTEMQEAAVWVKVYHSRYFWQRIETLVGSPIFARIDALAQENLVYFVTDRASRYNAQRQTYYWLEQNGIMRPNVIVSKRKGDIARAVGATHVIEDKWDNAQCIHWISDSPQTKVYLLNRPYNQVPDAPHIGAKGVTRVRSLNMFLSMMEEA